MLDLFTNDSDGGGKKSKQKSSDASLNHRLIDVLNRNVRTKIDSDSGKLRTSSGLKIPRRFTKKNEDPYTSLTYEKRTSVIRNTDGSTASKTMEVEVPSTWSQVATDILAQKYIRRKDVPQLDAGGKVVKDKDGKKVMGAESSVKQVVNRLVGCWRAWGERYHYFNTSNDAQVFSDELAYMLLHQMAAPNSPQWFNTGLNNSYGIKGSPQGHYYVDPVTAELKKSKDAYSRPQPHACFIQAVEDNLLAENGIYSLLTREGRIFKYGSGTGTNFSYIRGAGEPLSGGGTSSGLMSFLRVYDRSAGAIKSGGTTRRAAKMVCLDLDHPEIESFITWKSKEESKVSSLVAGSKLIKDHMEGILALGNPKNHTEQERKELHNYIQKALNAKIEKATIQRALELAEQDIKEWDVETYDTHFEGGAYETVSGQNSNNSIRVPNEFMCGLSDDSDWQLKARFDGTVVKTVKARELWNKISRSAWECADPGIQFDDTINEWHTCPQDGKIRASNPCSEYMFLDDTACNLASINLDYFQNEKGEFLVDDFQHAVRLWTIVLEISVVMAQFPSSEIAQKSYDYRTLGLGYANLGTILMKAGIPYDSDKAEAVTGAISALMGGAAYATSAEMASVQGPFSRYEANKEDMLGVIRNHRRAIYNENPREYENLTIIPKGVNKKLCPGPLLKAAQKAWNSALELGEKYGFRNAQVTVIAPTGTIGLVMDCDTTGIEPDFALIKFKKLAGGGYFKIVNQSVATALKNLGYSGDQIREIDYNCKGHGTLENAPHINDISLKDKGFGDKEIHAIEKSLDYSMELSQCFNTYTIDKKVFKELGIDDDTMAKGGKAVLHALGFSSEQIEEANFYICGTQTIEGAPHLKEEHLPVFDCANRCGPRGVRSISPYGHIRIMAAAQPFISGAISKTVNVPFEYTIEDIKKVYMDSWHHMIKSIALYRDGSKLSQPLNSASTLGSIIEQALVEKIKEAKQEKRNREADAVLKAKTKLERRRLPSRRGGFVQEASVGGHKVFLRTGEYPDGKLGEIFIDMYKEGASYRAILNCFAVLTSKALQYGVPLEELVETFTFTRFEPAGIVEGHSNIKQCTSILDFIFRTLGLVYLKKTDFVHIKPVDGASSDNDVAPEVLQKENVSKTSLKPMSVSGSSLHSTKTTRGDAHYEESRLAGYTGETCSACGSVRVRRNGTCTVCDDCGTTSGCS